MLLILLLKIIKNVRVINHQPKHNKTKMELMKIKPELTILKKLLKNLKLLF